MVVFIMKKCYVTNSCSVGAEMQHSSVEIKAIPIPSLDRVDQTRYGDSLA